MSQENYVPSTPPELKNIADCAVSNLIPENQNGSTISATMTLKSGVIKIM
jgi:hypothetical protein